MMNHRKTKSPEHIEQTKFVQHVRTFYPELVCMAVPNGSNVSAAQRIRLTHEGMLAGAPDVLIFGPGPATLAIEFKRPDGKGRISDAQHMVHVQMEAVGVGMQICNSSDEAKKALHTWIKNRYNPNEPTQPASPSGVERTGPGVR